MGLLAKEVVDVVLQHPQLLQLRHPALKLLLADEEQLRIQEGLRRHELAEEGAGPPCRHRRLLVAEVHSIAQAGIGVDFAQTINQRA